MKYALIKGGVVENIAMAEDPSVFPAEYIAVAFTGQDNFATGSAYDADTGEFTAPVAEEIPADDDIDYRLDTMDFRRRFTVEEKAAIYSRAKDDVLVEVFLDDLRTSTTKPVYLNHPEIIQGVQYLESLSVLTPERAAEILTPYA